MNNEVTFKEKILQDIETSLTEAAMEPDELERGRLEGAAIKSAEISVEFGIYNEVEEAYKDAGYENYF